MIAGPNFWDSTVITFFSLLISKLRLSFVSKYGYDAIALFFPHILLYWSFSKVPYCAISKGHAVFFLLWCSKNTFFYPHSFHWCSAFIHPLSECSVFGVHFIKAPLLKNAVCSDWSALAGLRRLPTLFPLQLCLCFCNYSHAWGIAHLHMALCFPNTDFNWTDSPGTLTAAEVC